MEFRRAAQSVLRSKPLNNSFALIPTQSPPRLSRKFPSRNSRSVQGSGPSFSTSSNASRQALAPKTEEDDGQPQAGAGPQVEPERKEPLRRINIAERFTTEQPEQSEQQSKGGPKRHRALGFLERARGPPLQSQSQKPAASARQDRQTQGSSQQGRPPLQSFNPRDLVPGTEMPFLRQQPPSPSSSFPTSTSSRASPASRMTSLDELTRDMPFRESMPYRPGDRNTFDLSRMQRPSGPYGATTGYSPSRLKNYNDSLAKAMAAPSFRMGPSLGRTVAVDLQAGLDVAKAFAMVGMKCSANMVRTDARTQRFHERPGVKRKRLHSTRWRLRFKENFRATVRRVEEMRRKGW